MQPFSTRDRGDRLTVYFNGACPICAAEIAHYQRISKEDPKGPIWADLSLSEDREKAIAQLGLTRDALVKRLHVLDGEGRVYSGIEAFIALWEALPRYRWAARLVSLPLIKHGGAAIYNHILAPWLYHWNQKHGRI